MSYTYSILYAYSINKLLHIIPALDPDNPNYMFFNTKLLIFNSINARLR